VKISDLPFEFPSAGIKPKAETCTEERSLKELIDEVVHRFPDRTALVGGGHAFTFAELDRFSAAVANFIRSLDHGPETVVAVLCNRGALVPAAALGIMRAGAVYLPVESDVPLARQEIMLAPARVILTDRANIRTAEYFQHKLPGDELGAFHGGELWYFFNKLNRCWRPFTSFDHELARICAGYLANFVKTGNPNGEGLPRWEADTNALQSTMRLQNPVYCCHAPNNAGVEYMIKSSTG